MDINYILLKRIIIEGIIKYWISIYIYFNIWNVGTIFYNKTLNNLWCCIVLHAVCNLFGIPSFNVRSNSKIVKILYYGLIIFGIVHSYIYIQKM